MPISPEGRMAIRAAILIKWKTRMISTLSTLIAEHYLLAIIAAILGLTEELFKKHTIPPEAACLGAILGATRFLITSKPNKRAGAILRNSKRIPGFIKLTYFAKMVSLHDHSLT
jgi:hypothetical protein